MTQHRPVITKSRKVPSTTKTKTTKQHLSVTPASRSPPKWFNPSRFPCQHIKRSSDLLARVSGDDEVNVVHILDGVLQDGVDRYAVIRRQFAHSLDDPEVVPAKRKTPDVGGHPNRELAQYLSQTSYTITH